MLQYFCMEKSGGSCDTKEIEEYQKQKRGEIVICKLQLTCGFIRIKEQMIKSINNQTDTVIAYGENIFHHIHSHHHYFQYLFPKPIHHSVMSPIFKSS